MEEKHVVYLSIGSNRGNRLQYLQRAVVYLSRYVGDVVGVSGVYETEAWGFKSDNFYNACVKVETTKGAEECIREILKIESLLGRVRTSGGYSARNIDIDIVFYDNEVWDNEKLVIPHPRMHDRMFVLKPLNEIGEDIFHHVLKKCVGELLKECEDEGEVKKIDKKLFLPKVIDFFERCKYIAVEGNIGVGKTSLAGMISRDFGGKLVLEKFEDNVFLEKFYKEPKRYGFAVEMSFLESRYEQMRKEVGGEEGFVVADYEVFKSLVFAEVTLDVDEYKLYRKIFNIMYKEVKKPDLYIYLYQNTDRILENIEKRGRSYEKSIKKDYLESIQDSYLRHLEDKEDDKVLIIDISDMDFVENEEDYYFILQLINANIQEN